MNNAQNRILAAVTGLVLHAAAGMAAAQNYPDRPIRIIVAFPPGASTDVVGRIVGQKMTEAWGQNVVIENRPGAGGNLGTQVAVRANPDGHTLLFNSSAIAVNVSLYGNPGYTMRDLVPVIQGPTTPNLISVHPSVKAVTLQQLIALTKTTPMSYGSSGTGTTPHLDMELLFKSMSKVDITHVPIGPAQAVTAVVGNQVPIGSTSMPPAVPQVKAGRLRPVAVTSAQRSGVLPDTPTVAESGFPGFADYTWFSLFAPAGTPPAIVKKLNAEINRILQLPDVRERLRPEGIDPGTLDPKAFTEFLASEVKRWAPVVRTSGAQAN